MRDYVIVSAARNEEAYLENTIESVVSQTVLPRQWIIVSDGSTDGTDEIVRRHASRHPFIRLITQPPGGGRSFGSKANAVNLGYGQARSIPHDFVAVLDADVSFNSTYYENIMKRFEEDSRLGIAGGILLDKIDGRFVRQTISLDWSVSGPIQMFRRECFEAIGGYRPLPHGGIDAVAEMDARMRGWKVRTFTDQEVLHLRRTGAEKGGPMKTCFRDGIKEYGYGCHPAFVCVKALSRIMDTPLLLGSLLRIAGYGAAWMRHEPPVLSPEFISSVRREQWARMTAPFRSRRRPCE